MSDKRIVIYTDGSCIPNPGRGGWAFIAIFPEHEFHHSGYKEYTTNNQMEMTSVIEALRELKDTKDFRIYTDSLYVANCAKGVWKRKINLELWGEYDRVSKGKNIEFVWVKGHSGDHYNELVDKMAKKVGKDGNTF